ncbi:MAG: hypothetical protein LW870_24780 [Pirellula sp.]|jgi:hypothetical protein|nr:hypothetical protein [Pirellula sp.]
MPELITLRDELDLTAEQENVTVELRLDSPFNVPESFSFDVGMDNNFVLEIRYLADAPAQEEPTEQCVVENKCKIRNGKFSRRIYRMEWPVSSNAEKAIEEVQHFVSKFGQKRNPDKYQTLIRLLGETTSRFSAFLRGRQSRVQD